MFQSDHVQFIDTCIDYVYQMDTQTNSALCFMCSLGRYPLELTKHFNKVLSLFKTFIDVGIFISQGELEGGNVGQFCTVNLGRASCVLLTYFSL